MGRDDIKDKIVSWLLDENFEVKSEQPPPNVPVEWIISVTVPAPIKTKILVQMPSAKRDRVVLTLGVAISDVHREGIRKLEPAKRLTLMTGILRDLILLCPDCFIAVQPNLIDPGGLLITKTIYLESLSRESLASGIKVLVNCFALIVARLNAELGITEPPRHRGFTGYM